MINIKIDILGLKRYSKVFESTFLKFYAHSITFKLEESRLENKIFFQLHDFIPAQIFMQVQKF